MSADGQGINWRRNIAENFNRLSKVHERYSLQTTDGQTDGWQHSERERERAAKILAMHNASRTTSRVC